MFLLQTSSSVGVPVNGSEQQEESGDKEWARNVSSKDDRVSLPAFLAQLMVEDREERVSDSSLHSSQ